MANKTQTAAMIDTSDWYIDLDCAPGTPRPDAVLVFVLEGTALTPADFVNTGRLFGNWRFDPKPEKLEAYGAARNSIAARIKLAYQARRIRYGSW